MREKTTAGSSSQKKNGDTHAIDNAGIQYVSLINDSPADEWNDILAINISSAFHLTKAVWMEMKQHLLQNIKAHKSQ